MSRLDEALRLSESARGAVLSEIEPINAENALALNQYRTEGHPRRIPELVPPPAPAESQEPATVAQVTVGSAAVHEQTVPDEHRNARLVTRTASTVSLEQYRKSAAVLLEAQVQTHSKTVMITSALPHEGKTLTAVNLALTLSESYARRVLVIDADLRSPSLHALLDVPNERGLSEALQNGRPELPFVQLSPRLSVLPAGQPGPEPLAGLSSPRMADVLAECSRQFDWVLIDTPPVGVLPDAQVLARLVGEVILVIGAGVAPADAIQRAVAELGGPEAITGTILNRVEEWRIPDAGYYGKYRAARTAR